MITLIIPVYNGEKYFRQCLESAINQSFSDYEIIIIDDGSTDRTGEICEAYKKRCDYLKVIRHDQNQGLVCSWQHGVQLATGAYIAFLDSDDWIDSKYLEKLSAGTVSGADIVCCNYNMVYENKAILHTERLQPGCYKKDQMLQVVFPALINDGTYLGRGITPHRCGKLFRKELFLKNLNYCNTRISYGEDLNIFFPAILDCDTLIILEDKSGLYFYRQNEASIIHTYKPEMFQQITLLRDRLFTVMQEKAVYDFTDQLNSDFWCLFMEYVKNASKSGDLYRKSIEVFKNYGISEKSVPYNKLSLKLSDRLMLFCLQANNRLFVYFWMKLYSTLKKV